MSNAAEPLVREVIPSGDAEPPPTPPPPAAQVITMTELEPPRAGALDPANGVHRPVAVSPAALGDLHAALRNVKAKLTVCIGSAEITVGDLLAAEEQQVLRLDRSVEQPVDVLLEGQVVARGMLIAVDEHFAVRITELPARTAVAARSAG